MYQNYLEIKEHYVEMAEKFTNLYKAANGIVGLFDGTDLTAAVKQAAKDNAKEAIAKHAGMDTLTKYLGGDEAKDINHELVKELGMSANQLFTSVSSAISLYKDFKDFYSIGKDVYNAFKKSPKCEFMEENLIPDLKIITIRV